MSTMPLKGIRVLDFTWVAAGPLVTEFLANQGAEVIKVESFRRVDLSRGRPPFYPGKSGINASPNWARINADKLSITLNMTKPEARELAKKLVSMSDIVIDNLTGGVMERWGMNYEELAKVKPDIIAVSMPVMGSTGPRRDYGAYGMGVEAISGIKAISGFSDRMPVGTGIAYPDAGPNPRHTLVAILAALHWRNKTGKGQCIEVSQYESSINFTGTAILEYVANNRLQPRLGNRHPHACPHGAYRCKGDDRWCVIAVFNDEEWQGLCRALVNPHWAREGKFATFRARKRNEDELDRLIEDWTIQRDPEEVVKLLQNEGVAAGIVQSGKDLVEFDPQLKSRNSFIQVDNPEAGIVTWYGYVARFSDIPQKIPGPAPLLGEHNDYVFRQLLGMSEEQINQLVVDEVIY